MSAVRIGIGGGGFGHVAHLRDWESLLGFLPAKAMDFRGEEGAFRNFRASLITYLPVKPEAPKMIRSKSGLGLIFWTVAMALI